MITVTKLTKTCFACPSQWEGETDDGKFVYIRYRWGYLYVNLSGEGAKSIDDAVNGVRIFELDLNSPFDGFMEEEELAFLLDGVINFKCFQ